MEKQKKQLEIMIKGHMEIMKAEDKHKAVRRNSYYKAAGALEFSLIAGIIDSCWYEEFSKRLRIIFKETGLSTGMIGV